MTARERKLLACFSDGPDGLVFWAFRYFVERGSIHASRFAAELARAWPLLAKKEQDLIRKEMEAEFARCDTAAVFDYSRYWCRDAWEVVRQAYRKDHFPGRPTAR